MDHLAIAGAETYSYTQRNAGYVGISEDCFKAMSNLVVSIKKISEYCINGVKQHREFFSVVAVVIDYKRKGEEQT